MLRIVTLVVLWGICLYCEAQKSCVSLEYLIETALKQNPAAIEDSLQKKVVNEIKKTWYNWLYAINSSLILDDYNRSVSDLGRIAGLRYGSGDIDYDQYGSSYILAGKIDAQLVTFENKARQYENALRQLSFMKVALQPADSTLDLYEIIKTQSFDYYDEDSLYEYNRFVEDIEMENRQIELDNLFIRIQYYRSYELVFASGIQKMAIDRLNSEDIEYLEYAALMTRAFKSRLEYLDVLNQYNQCAIELEYYAY